MSFATPGWNSDVSGISYPLLSGANLLSGTPFPRSVLVDAVFVMGPGVDFDRETDLVTLTRVERVAGGYVLEVLTSALPGQSLEFVVADGDSGVVTAEIVETSNCEGDWAEGWLTIKDLSSLGSLIPEIGNSLLGSLEFEPATVHLTKGSFVTGVTIANTDRTRSPAPGTTNVEGPRPTRVWYGCLKGPLLFKPGYNARIRTDSAANILYLGAGLGLGEGKACSEIPTYPGELPPPGFTTLDGSYTCGEVVRSINGVPGPSITIEPGAGITVESDPDNHRVIVKADV